jgi:hypothetical protein
LSSLKALRSNAFDYFGDGSFCILDSPGHVIGHLCALARVTSSLASFIFIGGEFRPSKYLPLPGSILPNPFTKSSRIPRPGPLFNDPLPGGDRTKPFFEISNLPDRKSVIHEYHEDVRTVGKVQEADAREEIWL